ncbi:hypothetical protein [Nostoc sp. DedQUE07]|uniref:hypothetical protein n=1 Tax=Nostoc sp. DedQUE07 TaxID=3075392 RepID=UPI002AD2A1B9|nr:hypothetical protein [Nostoc sp. DedQUE07]MDZ8131929.1 hypothetical protein [Nostoc sp. DedQUE07]
MFSEELEQPNEEAVIYAPDTAIPKDLAEVLQLEKQRRIEILIVRKKVLTFFVGWTFHATGVAIAKWCLVIGGSGALWTAATLCFTVAFVPTSFLISGMNINYVDGQFQVSDMQKAGNLLVGAITAVASTWLAVRENQALLDLSNQTVVQISEDIRTIQKQYPQSDPWLSIVIAGVLFFGAMFAFGVANRR